PLSYSCLPCRRPILPDQPGSIPTGETQPNHAPADAANQLNPAVAGPAKWARIDRMRLLLWAGIAFLVPMGLLFGLHLFPGRKDSVLTVQSELPIKAVMVFFVVLATWIVSRIEKRTVDEYGIPLREAFGKRFWEGSVWGFA